MRPWLCAASELKREIKRLMCAPASSRERNARPILNLVESSTRTIAYLKRPSFDSGSGPQMSMWMRRPGEDSTYRVSTWLSRFIEAAAEFEAFARTLASEGGASAGRGAEERRRE